MGYINVITEDEGMRPACWLDMTKVVILSGTGTMEDPYVLMTAEAPAAAEEAVLTESCCTPGECTCCASCTCGCQ